MNIDILNGTVCPYCGRPSELIDSAEIYNGVSYGMAYICRQCDAHVGCHKGTTRAFGRLANKELRHYKHLAHDIFDMIWRNHFMDRHNAYTWLSQQLGTERDLTHMGMFDVADCKRVIAISKAYLLSRNADYFAPKINALLNDATQYK